MTSNRANAGRSNAGREKAASESVLEGFRPVDLAVLAADDGRQSVRCHSRHVLEAFKESGEAAISKPMRQEDLEREAYNLRAYRKHHQSEFGDVGISARRGQLTLYRVV